MTFSLVVWLIFKSLVLIFAALFAAATGIGFLIGGVLIVGETPPWLSPSLLLLALLPIVTSILCAVAIVRLFVG